MAPSSVTALAVGSCHSDSSSRQIHGIRMFLPFQEWKELQSSTCAVVVGKKILLGTAALLGSLLACKLHSLMPIRKSIAH